MTRAHVPPRTAGNSGKVTSAAVQIRDRTLTNGRYTAGGLWVRGLCEPCNGLAGRNYDLAYGEFAKRLETLSEARRLHLLRPWEPPPVRLAPGLVARSIVIGMFAVSPQLRVIFPDLAADLVVGRDHIQMPQGATLRFALFPASQARIAGPMSAHRVLTKREDFTTFAEAFFRPLAWVLAPTRANHDVSGESVLEREAWACADEWLQYGPDVRNADLRDLVRRVPVVTHPLSRRRDEWMEVMSEEITPVLEGLIPA